jgi:hypothetical protein
VRALRDGGRVVRDGFGAVGDAYAEALRLGCSHIVEGGKAVILEETKK